MCFFQGASPHILVPVSVVLALRRGISTFIVESAECVGVRLKRHRGDKEAQPVCLQTGEHKVLVSAGTPAVPRPSGTRTC